MDQRRRWRQYKRTAPDGDLDGTVDQSAWTRGRCAPATASRFVIAPNSRRYFVSIGTIKTIDLKSDMPSVSEALQRMDRELVLAMREKCVLVKLLHGYGSRGVGGDIRIAVQKRLYELAEERKIRGYIFGENWSKSDDQTWQLLRTRPDLKLDPDLGRRNPGITIVLL